MDLKIVLTEMGLITLFLACIGCVLKFQQGTHESRCNKISCCWNGIYCERENLDLEMSRELHRHQEETKETNERNTNPIIN